MNVPDDVATRLGEETNASAYVTRAVRDRMQRERGLAELAGHFGPEILSEESRARGRAKLAEARERVSPERRAELRERYGVSRAS